MLINFRSDIINSGGEPKDINQWLDLQRETYNCYGYDCGFRGVASKQVIV